MTQGHPPPRASIAGFSFGKNLTKLNYPVEAAVRSVLPVCERFFFAVGRSDDDTRQRVAAISPKVEIIDTVWPEVHEGGKVLAIEANKAMAAATQEAGCTWGFYIQADEVVHEDDLPAIRAACDFWAEDAAVKALLFRYLHFVFDYETTDPWMYHKASRIVRLDGSCAIVGDACGPAITNYSGPVNSGNGYLDKHHLGGAVRWAANPERPSHRARIFHYGWVKTQAELDEKLRMVADLWWGDADATTAAKKRDDKFGRMAMRYPILKKYRGTHPAVMRELIAQRPPHRRVVNRWLNPALYAEVLRHGFHG